MTVKPINTDVFRQLADALRGDQEAARAFDVAAAELLRVNLTDLRCLGALDQRGRMAASELAVECGLTTGSMTVLIDRLERQGYVERQRDEIDRRRVFVDLTPKARSAIAAIWGPLGAEGQQVAQQFSLEELQVITRYLQASRTLLAQHRKRLEAMNPIT